MNQLRLQRIRFIREWRPIVLHENLLFPAEKALVDLIHKNDGGFFKSFAFPYADDDRYHYYLTFLIEALELLPLKVDLAFDACWRAFESLLFEKNPARTKAHEVLSEFCKNYVNKEALLYNDGVALIARLLDLPPAQTCEYLAQRLLKEYDTTHPTGQSKRIIDRLNWSNNNVNFLELLRNIAMKYNAPNISQGELRRASFLLRKVLKGESVSVGTFSGQLTIADRLSLMVLGVLHTFRNDRFHGNMQPPFKSSVATLQTYAHAHYVFLFAYFLFLQSIHETGWVNLNPDEVKSHLLVNIDLFKSIYGKHLER